MFLLLALFALSAALPLAILRGLLLFWPTMILLGALHTYLSWVPPLGWWPTVLVLALLGLLIPTNSTSKD